jgi:hypothetical protein
MRSVFLQINQPLRDRTSLSFLDLFNAVTSWIQAFGKIKSASSSLVLGKFRFKLIGILFLLALMLQLGLLVGSQLTRIDEDSFIKHRRCLIPLHRGVSFQELKSSYHPLMLSDDFFIVSRFKGSFDIIIHEQLDLPPFQSYFIGSTRRFLIDNLN